MANALTIEEFNQWEPFSAAYSRLAALVGYSEIRDEFRQRLGLGELRGVARRVVVESASGERTTSEYLVLPTDVWLSGIITNQDNIWTTSSHRFATSPHHSRYSQRISCTGLRLEPSGLGQILTDAGIVIPQQAVTADDPISEIASRRQDLPLLPEPIARAWAAWFKNQAGATKDSAEKSARQMFPNHNFSRDRIRELMGPSNMGRPKKNN